MSINGVVNENQGYIVNEETLEDTITLFENQLKLTNEYNRKRKEISRLYKEILYNLDDDKKHLLYNLEECINSSSLYFEKRLCEKIIKDKKFINNIID